MAAKIIDGKAIAAELRAELAKELEELKAAGAQPGHRHPHGGRRLRRRHVPRRGGEVLRRDGPGLSQRDPAGRRHRSAGDRRGARASTPTRPCPASCRCGPSRAQVSDSVVINSIDVDKDVDCFHPFNMGRLTLGEPTFPPATPAACMELLERYLRAEGKDVDRGARRRRSLRGGPLQHRGQAAGAAAAQPQRHHHRLARVHVQPGQPGEAHPGGRLPGRGRRRARI